jgi:hypothetical protein
MVSNEDKQLIAELAKQDMAASIIGEKFGLSAREVRSVCDELGVFVRHKQSVEENEKLREMVKSRRYTFRVICDTLRVGYNSVIKVQQELGISRESTTAERNKKVKQVFHLCKDGMRTREACEVVGLAVSTYNQVKYTIGLVKKKGA